MNFPSVSNFSIVKGTGGVNPPELYLPLWWNSGTAISTNSYQSAGSGFMQRGTTSVSTTKMVLHVLNSNWSAKNNYAFEAVLGNSGGANTYAELWDITSNTAISSSQITTTSGSYTVVRSGLFTLTPGHSYGITVWASNMSAGLTDASLIVFPS